MQSFSDLIFNYLRPITPLRASKRIPGILVLLLSLFLLHSKTGIAQLDATMYHMSTIPQLKNTNPSSTCDYKLYIGIPVISSIYADVHHNGFVLTDLLKKRSDDSLYLDMDNAISKMGKQNIIGGSFQMDWILLGWGKEQNRFFLNITEKAFFRFRYPKDLMRLLWEGNATFIDETADLSGLALRATYYREYAFGYAREVNDKWTLGGKLKYLYGIVNVSSKVKKLSLFTTPNTYDLVGESDMVLNTSFIEDDGIPLGDYLFYKTGNHGLGIDLGATYKANDKWTISLSMIDLGFIRWKHNTTNYTNNLDQAAFRGNAITTFIDSTNTDPFSTIADSLEITFVNFEETNKAYTDGLQTRFYLGGTYNINETNNVGGLIQMEYWRKKVYPTFTLSYNYRIVRWLGASISYSIMNRSYFNLGIGLSGNLGPIQIYAVTDNIAYLFNMAKFTGGGVFPQKAKTAQFHVGLNLTFGKNEKDRDKDGIIDKKDECPDDPGPEEYNGCPDRDGDGIIDIKDDCPDDPGLAIYKGCPDRDGDKVIDKEDKCPDVPGSIDNQGCPLKLHLLGLKGDTLMTGDINEDGFFVFQKLPSSRNYLFALEADNSDMVEEVQILHTLDGKETILTATREEHGYFIYTELQKKQTRLFLIDAKGDTLMTAEMNEEGFFVFQPLPADRSHLFLLDAAEDQLEDEILILLIDKEGNEKVIHATQDGNNKFRYEYITPKADTDLDVMVEEDVPVILLEEEEEILNTAFENLEFNSGSEVIRLGSFKSLQELSELLLKKPEWRIKLSGHTDNIGSPTANLLLSKKRSEAVKTVLVKGGVAPNRVIVKYYGETQPIESNTSNEGRQKNRRVEMLIIQAEDYIDPSEPSGAIKGFEGETGLWFRVQILTSGKKIDLADAQFKGVKNVEEYFNNGVYKYTSGKSTDFDQLNKVILRALKKKGFTQSFIVAFKDGKRIPVSDALKLLND